LAKEDRVRIGIVVLVASVTTAGVGCALLTVSRDYILSITCMVSDVSGQALSGAEVTVLFPSVPQRTIAPTWTARKVTTDSGGAVFIFHQSHPASMPYILAVSKPGYLDGRAQGVATPGREGTHVSVSLVSVAPGGGER
jgi:hypothetical protein